MRIHSLYIENFGGLSRYELTLSDGFGSLCLPNGWGKSTLAVFIKAMLYGLPLSTKRSLIENERKRYTPWQGGVFGGSMVVEIDGCRYRIERTFGAKESEDTLFVSDPETGVEADVPWARENRLGELLLGVDAAAYERSTYLSQRGIGGDDGELSIHAKLNRLLDATDDLASYDAAMELLDKQRKHYTVSGGRRGAIADTEARIAELATYIDTARRASEQAERTTEEVATLEKSLQENEQGQRALHEMEIAQHRAEKSRALYRHYQALLQTQKKKKEQIARTLHGVGGQIPTDEQIDALTQALGRVQAAEAQLAVIRSEEISLTEKQASQMSSFEKLPDERALSELSTAASEAQSAALALQMLSENTQQAQERAADPLPSAQELSRMRGFCTRYPDGVREADEEVAKQVATVRELDVIRIRSGRACRWLTVAAAVLSVCALVGLLLQQGAQGVLGTIAWIGDLLFLAGTVTGAVWTAWRGRRAAAAKVTAEQALSTAKEKRAAPDETLHRLLARLRRYGDVNDVQEALTLIEAMERQELHRELLSRENEEKMVRLASARLTAEQTYARLCALWREYGQPPAAQDAPVAVERLRQMCDEEAVLRTRAAALQKERTQGEQALLQAKGVLSEMLAQYPDAPDCSLAVAWLTQQRQTIHALCEESEAQDREIAAFVAREQIDPSALTVEEPSAQAGGESLEAQRSELERTHGELERKLALLRQRASELAETAAQLDTLEPQLAEQEELLARQRAALRTVELTQKHMENAKKQLSERYLLRMKNSFAEYYAALTGDEALSFTMDGGFHVKVRAMGVQRSTDSFSVGQRDTLALCGRMALVDALFEKEAPFLIFDDPFVNMDDETVRRALALLEVAAKKYQILYLTCHSSRTHASIDN